MAILSFFQNWSNLTLIGFLIILAVYLWYAFAIIYHFLRFGIGITPKLLALIFFVGSFVLFLLVTDAYAQVNWGELFASLIKPPLN